MIQIPKNFALQREEQIKKKIQESEKKLNDFLESEGLVLLPVMNRNMDSLVCSFRVIPKEFMKVTNTEDNKKEEGNIVTPTP